MSRDIQRGDLYRLPRAPHRRVFAKLFHLLVRLAAAGLQHRPVRARRYGVHANASFRHPYWTVLQSSGGQPDEKVKQFGKDTPMGRPGQPVEIAPLYVTLASDACSYTSHSMRPE